MKKKIDYLNPGLENFHLCQTSESKAIAKSANYKGLPSYIFLYSLYKDRNTSI